MSARQRVVARGLNMLVDGLFVKWIGRRKSRYLVSMGGPFLSTPNSGSGAEAAFQFCDGGAEGSSCSQQVVGEGIAPGDEGESRAGVLGRVRIVQRVADHGDFGRCRFPSGGDVEEG